MSTRAVWLDFRPSTTLLLITEISVISAVSLRSTSVAVKVPVVIRPASVSTRVFVSLLLRELRERTGSSLAPWMVMTTSCVAVLVSLPEVTPESSVMEMV